ncbi:farnesol dehydrogenase-like [Sitodiplosis mosellana]|uniref:farnesol dehydrogenase-like n=1 Tax=Sitodiplosis mosellana TaxID=263140 RepID=UPI002444B2F6|nr:farnesol dehydrogenase-like [Sitodiplosis mosellana]
MERLAGRVAVVTGAASGIGAAICTILVKHGMIVCGLARRKDKVEALRLSLFGAEGQLNAVECDITKDEDVKRAYQWIEKTLGGIDLLINNAGVVSSCMLLDDNNTRELRSMLEANLIGLCICTRDAIKLMRQRGFDGHIVNINSIFGHKVSQAVPGTKPINGMYPTCKFALTALTECLRQEVAYVEMGIKVSNISPGLVENDILTTSGSDENELVKYMPRLKPDDVAQAVVFAITMPQNVLIQDIIMKPMGEFL